MPSANLGAAGALFEAVHGTAPDIAGQNRANPTALLLAAVMMLQHLQEHAAADHIQTALTTVLSEGRVRTRDLGGTATTAEFVDALCHELEAVASKRH